MDEMNPLEKQLQSWTPRRPSPEIARRLFGPAETPSVRPALRASAWNWLSPAAACALTMLLAVHTASHAPGRLALVRGHVVHREPVNRDLRHRRYL